VTGHKKVTIILPPNYGIVYANCPVLITQKENKPDVIMVKVEHSTEEKFEIIIKAKRIWEVI